MNAKLSTAIAQLLSLKAHVVDALNEVEALSDLTMGQRRELRLDDLTTEMLAKMSNENFPSLSEIQFVLDRIEEVKNQKEEAKDQK